MRREQDAYRSELYDLLVEGGYRFFKHPPVSRPDSTAEVLFRTSSRQFQGTPSLFSDSGLRCHRRLRWCRPALGLFLLGFNELRIESSGHEFIVIISGSGVRDPWAGSLSRAVLATGCRAEAPQARRRELIINNTCLFWR